MSVEKHQVLDELRKHTNNNLQGDLLDYGDAQILNEMHLETPGNNIVYIKQVFLNKEEASVLIVSKIKKTYTLKYKTADEFMVFEVIGFNQTDRTVMPIPDLKEGDFIRLRAGASVGEDIDAHTMFYYKGKELGRHIGYAYMSDILDRVKYVRRT